MPTNLSCTTSAATPASVKVQYPCLYALSDRELKAIIVHCLGTAQGITLRQILANSACLAGGLSRKEKLIYLTAMVANFQENGKTVSQLRKEVPCTPRVPESTLDAAILWLFCNYYQQAAV